MNEDRAAEIRGQIADLKKRWPAHSAPIRLWEELEELENQLEAVEQDTGEDANAGERSPHRSS